MFFTTTFMSDIQHGPAQHVQHAQHAQYAQHAQNAQHAQHAQPAWAAGNSSFHGIVIGATTTTLSLMTFSIMTSTLGLVCDTH